jgi:amino acid adenylation domain-containing protein
VTDDNLARRLSGLSAAKRALLDRLLADKTPPPARRRGSGPGPLSFAQERLWFLHQLDPASAAYTVFHALPFDRLDVRVLERAVDALADRHEVLRTRFVALADGPAQIIEPAARIAVEEADVCGHADRTAAVRSLAEGVARTRFDLARVPLVRVVAARLSETDWAVLLAMHHIVVDGWSMSVLLGELRELYAAARERRDPALAPLPLQYADYAVWQRRVLSGPRLEALLAHWREVLRGAEPLELPTDRPRLPVERHGGAVVRVVLDRPKAEGLRTLAREEGASLFMCLLAVHGVLLSRWSGQEDVVVGTPTAGRHRAELEGLVGFLVNTVVLRLRLDGAPSFRELLRRVRSVALDAYAHDELPFERLVRELAPNRDPGRNPLVQTTFQLLEGREREGASGGFLAVDRPAVAFDLQVDVTATELGLAVRFAYSTDLFDAATVARMAAHYATIAAAVASDPDAPLSAIALLTRAEVDELEAWNRTGAHIPDVCVHTLVEAQARRNPDRVAVADRGVELSYGELDVRADTLARHLAALGAGPDRPIAVLLERGADLILAQLATLKAGAAYLPLDPQYPWPRLAAVLAQARPPVLVTDAARAAGLPVDAPPAVVVDRPLPPEAATPAPVGPRHLAYLIATSGTSGTPKLVAVEHRSLVNLVLWHRQAYAVTDADRAPLAAAASFDASVWETWPYLAAGATLVVPDDVTRRSPRDMLGWLVRERITLAFLATPLAEAVLAEELPSALRLRALLTGGDILHAAPSGPLPFALVNHYGPTECTVVATATPVAPDAAGLPPPIGSPIRNVETHVLDRLGRPQPVGVPGELHLAGAALARGYYGDPEATGAAFGPHAHSPGRRLYRTGDRVVRLADGRLRFLGRVDDQLEVRGMRVEVGDVISQLLSFSGVRQAAVAMHGNAMAAYVVPQDGTSPDPSMLRAHLAERLPAALVPTTFNMLHELPLTPNGKVDLRGLPPPVRSAVSEAVGATPTEAAVADIFADLLDADRIELDDDFFELGGHSLLATRLVSRIRAVLDTELPVRRVFEAGSIRLLAAAVDEALAAGKVDDVTVLKPVARARYRTTLDEEGRLLLTDEQRAALLGTATADAAIPEGEEPPPA